MHPTHSSLSRCFYPELTLTIPVIYGQVEVRLHTWGSQQVDSGHCGSNPQPFGLTSEDYPNWMHLDG